MLFNEEGKPRNKRHYIGKIDPITGDAIYIPEYLARMEAEGRPLKIPQAVISPALTVQDIRGSTVRSYGAFYLYEHLAQQMGLLEVLREALPDYWQEVFNLSAYLVSTGDPFAYCEDWLESTEAYSVGSMASQRISELLTKITEVEREKFYHLWCSLRSEKEYLALDITSISSYSELIESVAWGYNRDGDKLPQINLCLLMGLETGYPIYQTAYNGSLNDVRTLKTTINTFGVLTGGEKLITVMDKGFFSEKNVNAMLSEKWHTDFLVAVPFTGNFATDLVKSAQKDIDTIHNTIVHGAVSLRGVTRLRQWKKNPIYAHVYYNANKAHKTREELYAKVASLRYQALEKPKDFVKNPDYTKYLIIRRSEKESSGYTVNIREDVVSAELEYVGWLVLISNCVTSAGEAIKIYRDKDVVEKGFLRLKNSLDLGRLRVHSERNMNSKLFVGFISLILLSGIHKVMAGKKLYAKMTMKKLILTLSSLKLQMVNDERILFPVTKAQREIYNAFGIKEPV